MKNGLKTRKTQQKNDVFCGETFKNTGFLQVFGSSGGGRGAARG